MHYADDPEQVDHRRTIAAFAAKSLAPFYQSDDRTAQLRRQQVLDMAAMGLTGLRIPEEHGGQAASAVAAGIAAEEVGRHDVNATYLIITSGLVSDIIVRNATPGQQAAWLPGIASGSTVPAICITEPDAGSDAAAMQLTVTPDGVDAWRLQGEKTSITLGMAADSAVVLGRSGGEGARGISAFWVDLHDPGVTRIAFDDLGSRAIGRAALHFDGVRVTRAQLIGELGQGFVSVMQGFDYSRAVIGLGCLGAAAQSVEETVAWCQDRVAFGRPIGQFQGVAFPLAESAAYLKGARHVCYEALWRKDQGLEHTAEAAMAKFWAPKLATEVIHQCLLTLGHLGYSNDSRVGQRLRDVIGLEIGDGTAQVSKLVISRHLLGRSYAP